MLTYYAVTLGISNGLCLYDRGLHHRHLSGSAGGSIVGRSGLPLAVGRTLGPWLGMAFELRGNYFLAFILCDVSFSPLPACHLAGCTAEREAGFRSARKAAAEILLLELENFPRVPREPAFPWG
jgi:hypothetical protein